MFFADRRSALVGDALGGMDALTGELGPRLAPSFTNDDDDLALKSLDRLAALDADKLLVVHGPNFNGPIADAISEARQAATS